MTDSTIAPDTDDLNAFETLFHGKATAPVEKEPELPFDDPDDSPEDEPLATDETDDSVVDDEPVDEQEEEVKPKKKTAQDRFNEMTAARRAAEREAEAERTARQLLEQRLAELEARLTPQKEPEAPVITEVAGPTPDDVLDDGTAKYPLGEFDPSYIRDLTRFTIAQEREAVLAAERQANEQRQAETAKAALQEQWLGKIQAVEETIPDIREQADKLDTAFVGIEPQYGEYLATTIMQMDHGPEVLYYLANNLEEAKAIAAAGPLKATIALGEIHSQFKSKPKPEPKVTQAPEPPPVRARGTGGRFTVPADTDDLDAFESVFFKK